MHKSDLLNWLRKEYQGWEALLDQIGLVRMDQPGMNGDWSTKDILAHLAGWNRWLLIRLQAAQRGEAEPSTPWPAHLQAEDEINAWIYDTNRGRSVSEVLDESHRISQQFLDAVQSLRDDVKIEEVWHDRAYHFVWVDDKRFPAGEFFDHFHDDHEPDICAWLARAE